MCSKSYITYITNKKSFKPIIYITYIIIKKFYGI